MSLAQCKSSSITPACESSSSCASAWARFLWSSRRTPEISASTSPAFCTPSQPGDRAMTPSGAGDTLKWDSRTVPGSPERDDSECVSTAPATRGN